MHVNRNPAPCELLASHSRGSLWLGSVLKRHEAGSNRSWSFGVEVLGQGATSGVDTVGCAPCSCADSLAGANLDNGDPETLLFSMMRFFRLLTENQKHAFLENL